MRGNGCPWGWVRGRWDLQGEKMVPVVGVRLFPLPLARPCPRSPAAHVGACPHPGLVKPLIPRQ